MLPTSVLSGLGARNALTVRLRRSDPDREHYHRFGGRTGRRAALPIRPRRSASAPLGRRRRRARCRPAASESSPVPAAAAAWRPLSDPALHWPPPGRARARVPWRRPRRIRQIARWERRPGAGREAPGLHCRVSRRPAAGPQGESLATRPPPARWPGGRGGRGGWLLQLTRHRPRS